MFPTLTIQQTFCCIWIDKCFWKTSTLMHSKSHLIDYHDRRFVWKYSYAWQSVYAANLMQKVEGSCRNLFMISCISLISRTISLLNFLKIEYIRRCVGIATFHSFIFTNIVSRVVGIIWSACLPPSTWRLLSMWPQFCNLALAPQLQIHSGCLPRLSSAVSRLT